MNKPAPGPLPKPETLDLPETLGYRIKNRLLGPPLVSAELGAQQLGKPTALAVLSSDVMSSSAYATEQMLVILVPVVGVAAFTLIAPLTLGVLLVLAFVTACYRQVVKAYPVTGGSYVVTRENFGLAAAQVPAAALLISYTITVAVSASAGADAIISALPPAWQDQGAAMWLAIAFVVLLAYGNLRGVREAGKVFALPTYFFLLNMAALIVYGLVRAATGALPVLSVHQHGAIPAGHPGNGILLGAGLFFILQAFAQGGSGLTGTEAISNAVTVFKDPQPTNARTTLILMSTILGSLFLGVSVLAAFSHAIPFVGGTPTVLSEIGKVVYGAGSGALGGVIPYYCLQASTAFVLILAANTSFNGFPFLVSFVAEDSFLPRQLTKRGHRLVFSNGIIVLTVASVVLLLVTRAKVASLIPLYAISVFAGFTMSGAGMTAYHWKQRAVHWRRNTTINGAACLVCLIVVVIFGVTEFTRGAWAVVVAVPLIVWGLTRTRRQYETDKAQLEAGAAKAAEARVLRNHVVLVLVDRLDQATARAIRYARTLAPDRLRAVHVVLDEQAASALKERWERLLLPRGLSLELVDCDDRRLLKSVTRTVAEELADGETEVSVLLPRRTYPRAWTRLLHDRTADRIAAEVGRLPHANATIVPYEVGGRPFVTRRPPEPPVTVDERTDEQARLKGPPRPKGRGRLREPVAGVPRPELVPGTTPIGQVQWRHRCKVAGKVTSVEVQPWGDVPRLTATVFDQSGGLTLVFGRREVPGLTTGAKLTAEGMVSQADGRLAIFNPTYDFLPDEDGGGPVDEDPD
ncbi:MAG: amino acid permease [Acidimicrobiales bacterium]